VLRAQREFAESLELDRLRIQKFPNDVFLCGGKYDEDPTKGTSVRHYYWHYLKCKDPNFLKDIVFAEKINDWFDGDKFTDLLHLERTLAELASLIVLFVESAGSMAELGAFALLETVKDKLFIVTHSGYTATQSFIKLGPVRHLEKRSKGICDAIPWSKNTDVSGACLEQVEKFFPELHQRILRARESKRFHRSFDSKNIGHHVLLTCDLVSIFGLSRKSEITRCLRVIGIKVDRSDVDRYLYCLEKLSYVERIQIFGYTYFRSTSKIDFMSFAFREGSVIRDRARWRALILENYARSRNHRLSALPDTAPPIAVRPRVLRGVASAH
jgi:hypothetical protein